MVSQEIYGSNDIFKKNSGVNLTKPLKFCISGQDLDFRTKLTVRETLKGSHKKSFFLVVGQLRGGG